MRKRDEDFLEPDLTPLIDVVFILLIFFLVTSVFKKQELAMILNLPKSGTSESIDQKLKKLVIEMKDNSVFINDKEVQYKELTSILKNNDSNMTIQIRSDKDTRYYKVIEVLDILKENNFLNINLITQKR